MNAWAAYNNGFIESAGSFWRKTVQLSPEQFEILVQKEISSLAMKELQEQAEAEYQARVLMKELEIKKELGLE